MGFYGIGLLMVPDRRRSDRPRADPLLPSYVVCTVSGAKGSSDCDASYHPRIVKSTFIKAPSDALDVDFSTGTIEHTAFIDSGNDAIDLSGSVVIIEDVAIEKVGDKGISSGEGSSLIVSNGQIRDAAIGVASKDSSSVDARDLTLSGVSVAFAAYQKKPEFGPATLTARRVEMTRVREVALKRPDNGMRNRLGNEGPDQTRSRSRRRR